MSYHEATAPECTRRSGSINLSIEAKEKDLGEFSVRRVLPAVERQMVGPFIFFDHMGPAEFPPGKGIQVRPHPHIGIATVTYLFDGEIMHRDSLGSEQLIRAGAVNLMTAGRGIVHSERAGSDLDSRSRLHGIQSWMALPEGQEEIEPQFVHTPATDLPNIERDGVTIRIIMGSAYGRQSPVKAYSATLYLDCRLSAGSTLSLPDSCEELAAYVVSGSIEADGKHCGTGVMLVACPGRAVHLRSHEDSRVMVIGGDPVGERHNWWNFVSSSKARIDAAKADWQAGHFTPVSGDPEFIPLPS